MSSFKMIVPASTANVGPGFDSAGIALSKYLTVHVHPAEQWEFVHQSIHLPPASAYEDHLIYQAAEKTAQMYKRELSPCRVIVESDIPLARGLGSSASAIIAGIELANQLCKLELTKKEQLIIATNIEGHPDNVAAALYGGLIVSVLLPSGEIEIFHQNDHSLDFVMIIPTFELKTEDARKVLPSRFTRSEAAAASAVGNVMFSAFVSRNYELAGKLMEEDLFHEPYRASLIPNYKEIRALAKEAGAYSTVISGAGPTLLSLAPKGIGENIATTLKQQYQDYSIEILEMDQVGLNVSDI